GWTLILRASAPDASSNATSASPAIAIPTVRRLIAPPPGTEALSRVDHPIDELVLLRLLGAHEVVALRVLGDLLQRLPGVLGDDLVESPAHVDDLLGVDLDVGRLALEAARDLVNEDLRVRRRHPLLRGAPAEQQRTHAHRNPDADRLDVGLDVLHRVVDREPR